MAKTVEKLQKSKSTIKFDQLRKTDEEYLNFYKRDYGFKEDTTEYIENPLLSLHKKEYVSTGLTRYEANAARVKQKMIDKEFQKTVSLYHSVIFPSQAGKDNISLPTPF